MGKFKMGIKQDRLNFHTQDQAPLGHYGARDQGAARAIAIWLYAMAALVALMVSVGGATRLTDSGLSITQWDLLMGALPPMSEEKWQQEFTLYQQIPEYELVNKGMTLADFKSIYWWEWSHRNLGRFIGLAYFIPLLIFWGRGALKGKALKLKLIGGFLLLMGQGLMGWLMVKSGLSERVDVSQYRLAAHLSLAFIFYGALMWMAFNLSLSRDPQRAAGTDRFRPLVKGFLALVALQIILGALVAGLRAGSTYNSWPLMDGQFFPEGYFNRPARFQDLFETMAAVQFNHRMLAYGVGLYALYMWWRARGLGKIFSRRAGWILMAVAAQLLLGIWTLVSAVPLALGLAHQLGALGVLSVGLYVLYWSGPPRASFPV